MDGAGWAALLCAFRVGRAPSPTFRWWMNGPVLSRFGRHGRDFPRNATFIRENRPLGTDEGHVIPFMHVTG